jgi:hypothetical protein
MSFKVLNIRLAGKLVGISTETVQFDGQGVGEIQSESIYNEVLQLNNFFPVQDDSEEKARLEAEAKAKAEAEEKARLESEQAAKEAEEKAKAEAEEKAKEEQAKEAAPAKKASSKK